MSVLTSVLKLFKYDPVADKKSTYNITQALNDNWDKIDAAMAAARSAEEYDPAGTYAAGDYCTHDGKLYRCTTAITGGEAWDPTHWAETSVGAEIAAAYAALTAHTGNTSNPHGVTPAQIGAAPASHNHDASAIASGILPVSRGGTGVSSIAALITAMSAAKMATGSYTGTGTYGSSNKNTLTFSFTPKLVLILTKGLGSLVIGLFLYGKASYNFIQLGSTISGVDYAYATWNENTVTWYCESNATRQLNQGGIEMTWIEFA